MADIARSLFGRTVLSRIFFGSLLLLLLIVTRWAWIDCDGGTPSLTEYGFFATDEGYYAGGGRQKFLRDRFISVKRAVPCTYAICPSTHLLTWLAFLTFGQTTWAHRVFPFLISTSAWLCLFHFLSRKTLAWIAFLLCAVCLLNPFLMVYGRTVCSDTLMAAVMLLGYIATRKKGRFFPFFGGFIFGLGLWVKQSIWVLFPLGISGAAMTPCRGRRLPRIGLFLGGFAFSALMQYGLIRLIILKDAVSQDVSIDHLLAISDSSYPLPNPFDWVSTFKGVSSFPRCPTDGLLSIWIAFFLALPGLLLLRRLTDRPVRWDGRLLLYLTLPLYAAGIMILPVYYAHYFIPIIAFVPILWLEARRDLKTWQGANPYLGAALMAAAILCVLFSFNSFVIYPDEAQTIVPYFSNAYNLPQAIVWMRNGLHILAAAGLLTGLALWARLRKPTAWVTAGLLLSALGVADLCFSQIPLAEAYKYTPLFSVTIKDVACLLQVCLVVLFFAVWVLPGLFRQGVRWHLLLPALFMCGTLANPVWRKGACELTERGYLHKRAVAELAKLVPGNAVVFGERAPQLFLSLKPRVCAAPNNTPVPTVLSIHEKYPEWPLFALLDSEHNYHYTHYMENKDKIQMEVIHTLRLPSFNNGLPSDVFLTRLKVLGTPAAAGPLVR